MGFFFKFISLNDFDENLKTTFNKKSNTKGTQYHPMVWTFSFGMYFLYTRVK